MSAARNGTTFAAIDVGSSKIAACIGRVVPKSDTTEVIGYALGASSGVEKGIVVDIDKTIGEINDVVATAQENARGSIDFAITNLNGNHIDSLNATGSSVTRKGEIATQHVDQALTTAQAVNLNAGKKIVHILPQQYLVDNQDGIVQPIGQAGRRLDAEVHLIMASTNAEENLRKCITKCGFRNHQTIVSPLAASNAVLDDDYRALGVCLIDIGHDTSGVVLYVDGLLKYTSVKHWGGRNVTHDIAKMLRTPPQAAEVMKRQFASVHEDEFSEEEIAIPGVGGQPDRRLRRCSLTQIVRDNYHRLFAEIKDDLERNSLFSDISSMGFVLTGGGSKIKDLKYLAEETFGRSASVEQPKVCSENGQPKRRLNGVVTSPEIPANYLNDPSMATVIGLLRRQVIGRIKTNHVHVAKTHGLMSTAARSVYRWMGGNV